MSKRIAALLVMLLQIAACVSPGLAPVQGRDRVCTILDVPYYEGPDADPVRHKLDIYLPKGGKDWPTALVVHGGAMVVNDKSVIDNFGITLADHGIAVACCNYRLYPHAKHPAQVEDVSRALSWTKAHMKDYGADTENFTLIGYSAGAVLAAMVTLDPRYLQAQGLHPDTAMKRAALISGVYDIGAVPMPFRLAFTHRASVWRDASPLNHVRGDAPPILLLHAEHDLAIDSYFTMQEQAQKLQKAISEAGGRAVVHQINGCGHNGIAEQVGREANSATQKRLLAFIQEDRLD